jgi:hypothetical protein
MQLRRRILNEFSVIMTVDNIVFVLHKSHLGPNFRESNNRILICQFNLYCRTCSVLLRLNTNTLNCSVLCRVSQNSYNSFKCKMLIYVVFWFQLLAFVKKMDSSELCFERARVPVLQFSTRTKPKTTVEDLGPLRDGITNQDIIPFWVLTNGLVSNLHVSSTIRDMATKIMMTLQHCLQHISTSY